MKKIFAVILSAMIVMSLAACGNSGSGTNSKAESVSSAASTESSKAESSQSESKNESSGNSSEENSILKTALEKVKAEVELPSDMADFDARRLKRVFGITDEQAEDFSGAICTDGLRQDEFIYVKAKNETAAKEIADKLQNDWQSKYNVIKNYDPDQVKIIESAKVETNGLYVSLVISEKADQIKQIYNDAIGV